VLLCYGAGIWAYPMDRLSGARNSCDVFGKIPGDEHFQRIAAWIPCDARDPRCAAALPSVSRKKVSRSP